MAIVTIEAVSPDGLDPVWENVTRTLAWQGVRGDIALPALRNLLRIGYAHLWVAPDWRFPSRLSTVIVTTIITRPRKAPALRIEFLSGRHIGTWIDSAACTLSQYAHAHGCTHLEFVGRIGWRQYRGLFDLPGTWLVEERAAGQCQLRNSSKNKPATPRTA
jgi:hypothetical protein